MYIQISKQGNPADSAELFFVLYHAQNMTALQPHVNLRTPQTTFMAKLIEHAPRWQLLDLDMRWS